MENIIKSNELQKNELRNQYKSIGTILDGMRFELLMLWEDSDAAINEDTNEAFSKIKFMMDVLEEYLKKDNDNMISKDSIEYLTKKSIDNLKDKKFLLEDENDINTVLAYTLDDIKTEIHDFNTRIHNMI